MITILLFIMYFYIATIIGIYMKIYSIRNFNIPNIYIIYFPILRIYLGYILYKQNKKRKIFSLVSTYKLLQMLSDVDKKLNLLQLFTVVRTVSYKI